MTFVEPQVNRETVKVYKMRDLSLCTSEVMKEITDSGRPALITLRGRFVAMITPLADSDLEDKMISAALEVGLEVSGALGEEDDALTSSKMLKGIGK